MQQISSLQSANNTDKKHQPRGTLTSIKSSDLDNLKAPVLGSPQKSILKDTSKKFESKEWHLNDERLLQINTTKNMDMGIKQRKSVMLSESKNKLRVPSMKRAVSRVDEGSKLRSPTRLPKQETGVPSEKPLSHRKSLVTAKTLRKNMNDIIKGNANDEILSFFQAQEDDDDEEDDTMTTRCCNFGIIRNSSPIKFYWDVFIIILVIYNTFAVPFDAAFGVKGPVVSTNLLDRIIDSIFCIDVVIAFRTSYFDNEGEEVKDGRRIAMTYIKSGRFFIDFIASVPLDVLIGLMVKK